MHFGFDMPRKSAVGYRPKCGQVGTVLAVEAFEGTNDCIRRGEASEARARYW